VDATGIQVVFGPPADKEGLVGFIAGTASLRIVRLLMMKKIMLLSLPAMTQPYTAERSKP
jgi:hypothetical protein